MPKVKIWMQFWYVTSAILMLLLTAAVRATPILPPEERPGGRLPLPLMDPTVVLAPVDDAEYWTILLIESHRENEGIGAFLHTMTTMSRQLLMLLQRWQSDEAAALDAAVEGEYDGRETPRSVLRYYSLDRDVDSEPVPADPALIAAPPPLADIEGVTAQEVEGGGDLALVPLSRLFLRQDLAFAIKDPVNGVNRFLAGPIDLRHQGRHASIGIGGREDPSLLLADISEWIDAILNYRPGAKTWIGLSLMAGLFILLRLIHHRSSSGPV